MSLRFTNALVISQREIIEQLYTLLGIVLIIHLNIQIEENQAMFAVTNNIFLLITSKGCIKKHHQQVWIFFNLLHEHSICLQIERWIFNSIKVRFLRWILSGTPTRIHLDYAKHWVGWHWPTSKNEVQQLFRLWNLYHRFIPKYASIRSPLMDQLWGARIQFIIGPALEVTCPRVTILYTSWKIVILSHIIDARPPRIESDESDLTIVVILHTGMMIFTFMHAVSFPGNYHK